MISKTLPTHPELSELIKKSIETYNSLSPKDKKEHDKQQRISWVYKNLSLSNPNITREMIEKMVENEK